MFLPLNIESYYFSHSCLHYIVCLFSVSWSCCFNRLCLRYIVCLFSVSWRCCFNHPCLDCMFVFSDPELLLCLHYLVHLFSVSRSCCFSHQCLEWSRQDWLRRWIMCSRSLTFPHRTECVRYIASALGVN